ncbi:MAG: DNA-binding response regulator [Acholeplasmatales bacterium]|nr:MAG: DNA-binding response regulator [Acholeplasmatales bacterium]
MRILLLEDEKKINDMLTLYIRQEGHTVKSFLHAEDALKAFAMEGYDLVISDLMLDGMQGETFISRIRNQSDAYIIVLTAKVGSEPKLSLLRKGVDDYITKPFAIDEVLLKLRNIERRIEREHTDRFTHKGDIYAIKEKTNRITRNAVSVNLNPTEIKIIRFLMKHPGQTLSRDQIIGHCLSESEAFDRIVDTYIKNIRRKLADKDLIETVYGEGYRFKGVRHA